MQVQELINTFNQLNKIGSKKTRIHKKRRIYYKKMTKIARQN